MPTNHRTIALTGGIGTGKTTVANLFRQRGARVIDADLLAREVVEPGKPALEEIRRLFGEACILPDGGLNRQHLALLIFSDLEKRRSLEKILHPRIHRAFLDQLEQPTDAPFTLYVVPLYFEAENPYQQISGVIVVSAPDEISVARVMARDKLDESEAWKRVRAQLPIARKVALADWVIVNDGDIASLTAQVENVFSEVMKA